MSEGKVTDCSSCFKPIQDGEELVTLALIRETVTDDVATVLASVELATWCKSCYAEIQQLLKINQ